MKLEEYPIINNTITGAAAGMCVSPFGAIGGSVMGASICALSFISKKIVDFVGATFIPLPSYGTDKWRNIGFDLEVTNEILHSAAKVAALFASMVLTSKYLKTPITFEATALFVGAQAAIALGGYLTLRAVDYMASKPSPKAV